jgi:hypothetical protein
MTPTQPHRRELADDRPLLLYGDSAGMREWSQKADAALRACADLLEAEEKLPETAMADERLAHVWVVEVHPNRFWIMQKSFVMWTAAEEWRLSMESFYPKNQIRICRYVREQLK